MAIAGVKKISSAWIMIVAAYRWSCWHFLQNIFWASAWKAAVNTSSIGRRSSCRIKSTALLRNDWMCCRNISSTFLPAVCVCQEETSAPSSLQYEDISVHKRCTIVIVFVTGWWWWWWWWGVCRWILCATMCHQTWTVADSAWENPHLLFLYYSYCSVHVSAHDAVEGYTWDSPALFLTCSWTRLKDVELRVKNSVEAGKRSHGARSDHKNVCLWRKKERNKNTWRFLLKVWPGHTRDHTPYLSRCSPFPWTRPKDTKK